MRPLPVLLATLSLAVLLTAPTSSAFSRTITDAMGRAVEIPERVERVICSGPGCLRLLTYLQGQDMAVGVDDMETRRSRFDARPYALANPSFKKLPTFGEFRGHDNPERILILEPQPQVIFKTYGTMGHDPVELQEKTGIPVVVLGYGELAGPKQKVFFQALRTMGEAVGRQERAEAVIDFFKDNITELESRTKDIPESERPSVFVGGVAKKGPHGYQSTEPGYPPFRFVNADNVAFDRTLTGKALMHADVAKEKIVEWNPDYLFLDLSTLQLGKGAGGLHELRTDPAYATLTAVRENRVYGLLPYNWYSRNFGSILANAWYVGGLLHPERFPDLNPAAKADEIYSFLVGEPVFEKMDEAFHNMAFKRVRVR